MSNILCVLTIAAVGWILHRLTLQEEIILALNAEQSAALQEAVVQIGTDLDELASRLENAPVDDPIVAEVITALRGTSERIDTIAFTEADPGPDEPPVDE